MADLRLGRQLANRKKQLEEALKQAIVNEALDRELTNDATVQSSHIEESIKTIEAHDDYSAHCRAEKYRETIMKHVNGDDAPATLEQLEAMFRIAQSV